MVATRALEVLFASGTAHQVHEYTHDPAAPYGLEAAESLGIEPGRVLKTLVVSAGSELAVAVIPVSGELNLKAMAQALGEKKVSMAPPAVAERASGYVIGGISPLGQKRPLVTIIDQSAVSWPTVFVSGGHRGLEIELAPADLVALTSARVARLARARGGQNTVHGTRTSR